MPLASSVGTCEECHKMFEYTLVHSGLVSSCYAYCEGCGMTAVLEISHERFPLELVKVSAYKAIAPALEEYLKRCKCGGRFTANAGPQCPHCRQVLCPIKAAAYLERSVTQKSPNWQWQMSWKGNYYIVIEGLQVKNNFV